VLKVESYKKGIVLSTVFNALNKVLVFLNGLLIAYYFGTNIKLDIYFYAYNTVLIVATFISGINTSVIIPESIRLRIQEGEDKAFRFLNLFIFGNIGLAVLICIICLFDPLFAFSSISKYNVAELSRNSSILIMAIPLLLLLTITTLLTDILTSYRFFTIPIVAGIINAIFSLVFVIFFHDSLDVRGILLGLLLSYSVNIVLLLTLMKKYLKWKFSIRSVSIPRRIWHNILFVQTGSFLNSIGTYAPLYFLSGAGIGLIASLNYAQQIVTQPTSFITNQIATVSRIKIGEMYAHHDYQRLNEIFSSTIKFLVFILLPISGLLFLYSHEVMSFLFKRGSFNETSVQYSANLLKYLALALPFTAIVSITANLYFAAQLIKMAIAYQVASNVALVALIWLLINKIGYTGYPVAYLAVNIINVLVAYFFCIRISPLIKYGKLLSYLVMMIAIHGLIVLGLSRLDEVFIGMEPLTTMIAGGIIYVGIIAVTSFVFKLNDDFNKFVGQAWKRLTGRFSV
jgi:putative peptidoglycan lipid II flippase